jgi:arsenate reductase-like glutaredoxin family protein
MTYDDYKEPPDCLHYRKVYPPTIHLKKSISTLNIDWDTLFNQEPIFFLNLNELQIPSILYSYDLSLDP